MPNNMRVILGAASVKAYVTAPRSHQVFGIVRLGQEYGLIATDAHGNFFRVNGSQVVPLNTREVLRAIEVAQRRDTPGARHHRVQSTPHGEVPVLLKRHRRFTQEDVHSSQTPGSAAASKPATLHAPAHPAPLEPLAPRTGATTK